MSCTINKDVPVSQRPSSNSGLLLGNENPIWKSPQTMHQDKQIEIERSFKSSYFNSVVSR